MWMFSGVFWPIECLPYFLRIISNFGPLTLPIDALRSVMIRGWTIRYTQVLNGYLISLLYTMTAFIITKEAIYWENPLFYLPYLREYKF